MKLHHIAYAVSSVTQAAKAFEVLGFRTTGDVTDDAERGVRILFVEDEDGILLELVEPLHDASPVSSLLEKNGGATTLYHLCFEADGIADSVAALRKGGIVPITAASPAPAIEGRDVQFAYGRKTGLIELVESSAQHD